MEHPTETARLDALVAGTLALHRGADLDTALLSLSEVLARVLAASDGDPDESLVIVTLAVKHWLASGVLAPRPRVSTRIQ